MNITLGNGKAVHATDATGQSLCHAEAVRSGGVTRCLKGKATEAEVTCKRCAKLTPAPAAAPAPQPEEAPAGHIRCDECHKHIPYNMKAITAHAAECF